MNLNKDFYLSMADGHLHLRNSDCLNCCSVFRTDGSLVMNLEQPEDNTILDKLMQGIYLVVLNLKCGKYITDVVEIV